VVSQCIAQQADMLHHMGRMCFSLPDVNEPDYERKAKAAVEALLKVGCYGWNTVRRCLPVLLLHLWHILQHCRRSAFCAMYTDTTCSSSS
jgi:hypothetical protein